MKKKNSKKADNIKTILDAYNKDIKRHMSALSEDFQGRVSAVAEQFLGVNRKLDSLDQKVNSHTEMIGNMAMDLEIVKADIEFITSSEERSENEFHLFRSHFVRALM